MPEFIAQTLNGLTLAGIIFLVSSGFTLVFGVMRVTNLSHGAVYLVGGYTRAAAAADGDGAPDAGRDEAGGAA